MISELKRLKERVEENYPLVHDEKQKQQLKLEVQIAENLIEYVGSYYNEQMDISVKAVESAGATASKQLLNNTIIFSSITKSLDDTEEDSELDNDDKLDYGYLEFQYSSQVDVV
ncbi:unnamed protein product [Adineta steineri]|uniref:Uncharacterized protein n=1 Tax=Adineta steineri TaxID=433720 RepID=A0A814Q9L7_9BILA|nr:unnamed protein product [Adineta steineri]